MFAVFIFACVTGLYRNQMQQCMWKYNIKNHTSNINHDILLFLLLLLLYKETQQISVECMLV